MRMKKKLRGSWLISRFNEHEKQTKEACPRGTRGILLVWWKISNYKKEKRLGNKNNNRNGSSKKG